MLRTPRKLIHLIWKSHPWLAATGLLMLVLLVGNLIGLAVDPRIITGSPAWLKPARFSISTAIYVGTLAWIIGQISVWCRFTKAVGTITAIMLMVEIFIINLQAWRGTTSHFNFSTNLDSSLFAVMGVGIAILWLASAAIAIALFRQEFTNRALGWALRLGMTITVLGAASGSLMTRPMPGQTSHIIGSHTMGAPDGGASIPIVGWSADHGDLRIAHFLGLHGMQAIPLLYWLLARKRRPQVTSIWIGAAAYLSAGVLLEWQALRGQSLLEPDAATNEAWLTWLAVVCGLTILLQLQTKRKTASEHVASLV